MSVLSPKVTVPEMAKSIRNVAICIRIVAKADKLIRGFSFLLNIL